MADWTQKKGHQKNGKKKKRNGGMAATQLLQTPTKQDVVNMKVAAMHSPESEQKRRASWTGSEVQGYSLEGRGHRMNDFLNGNFCCGVFPPEEGESLDAWKQRFFLTLIQSLF